MLHAHEEAIEHVGGKYNNQCTIKLNWQWAEILLANHCMPHTAGL